MKKANFKKGVIYTEINKDDKKTVKRLNTWVDENGNNVISELTVGKLHNGNGWFEIETITGDNNGDDEKDYSYSEGSLIVDNGEVVDYDGVYELNAELKPLISKMGWKSTEVF